MISQKIKQIFAFLSTGVAAISWGYYHFSKHDTGVLVGKIFLVWFALTVAYFFGKKLFLIFLHRTKADIFWSTIFYAKLDALTFRVSLLFLIYFFRNEFVALLYALVMFTFLFRYIQSLFARHPQALSLLKINRVYFQVFIFLFVVVSACQFAAYHYYILDSNIRFFGIVFFRSFALTVIWLALLSLASILVVAVKNVFRYVGLVGWALLFTFVAALWTVNVGVLYYSGLYISPVALAHADGAGGVIANPLSFALVAILVFVLGFVFVLLRLYGRVIRFTSPRVVITYASITTVLAFSAIVGLSSVRSAPEAVIGRSFYDYYFGAINEIPLDPTINAKLAKFGLHYNPDAFYVNDRARIFTPTTTVFLPKQFAKVKPNIVVFFVESFSARFSGAYNPGMVGVTPHFDAFATDPNTTIFKNYFNASTPTITGTMSQLCSILPPTGHGEIETEGKMQNHHLLCLPELLKKEAGFSYAAYLTAVDKEYAHKEGIFTSMGVDNVFGTSELAKLITGDQLSWGYSDHQMFPALFAMMQTAPQPFLLMQATVDSHPPFNLSKDVVSYGDGTKSALNMFHTTDDAFGTFWQQFKASPFASTTIVMVVADHAAFPGDDVKQIFPEDADALTYYDPNFFALYVPGTVLPKEVNVLSSGIDLLPTLAQIFSINVPNSFEGHSIFDDRSQFPNILGMHELGLYVNQVAKNGKRETLYNIPTEITCPSGYMSSSTPDFTLCDYRHFYEWKRSMFEQGRFWKRST